MKTTTCCFFLAVLFGAPQIAISAGGELKITPATPAKIVDLSAEGKLDWAHWGRIQGVTILTRKKTTTPVIGDLRKIGVRELHTYENNPTTFSWSDGMPAAEVKQTRSGVFTYGENAGFEIVLPADTTARTAQIFSGVWRGQGRLEAALSDASAPSATAIKNSVERDAGDNVVFNIRYRAAAPGQTLTLKWINTANQGNVTFQALALKAELPFFEGLGSYTRKITTESAVAQRYFNQGLAFLHGFNHGAAIRSFQEAAELDPTCSMAHWAIALASGPHINFPLVPPPAAELAWKELGLANKHAAQASPVERALIEALNARYANPQPEDRAPLDRAYADAMRKVWQAHPDDPDAGAFFAEALMNLRPWDQWTPQGQAQPGTDEILATLDSVLKLNINHPLANHLYIHAVEASPHPERADAPADRMRALQPGLAHNVHMPSHIDVRRGRWQQAIESNLKAVEADRRHREIAGPPTGFLTVYIAHNEHMLAYAAMMTGQSKLALDHMRAMVAGLPASFLEEYAAVAEGLVAMPLEVLVRFGRWDNILSEPDNYAEFMPFTRAFHYAARAIAQAAKGDPEAARKEQARYLERAKLVPEEETLGNNTARGILAVVTPMVEGEILIREGKLEEGLAQLRAACAAEDVLKYDEPPGWLVPVRHSLGASLVRAGRFPEAEQIYRDDLARLPENGWSLFGLAQSLRRQGKNNEAAAVEARFQKVWAKADLQIASSCLCQPAN